MDRATFFKILALGATLSADARRLLGQVGIEKVTDPLKVVTDPALLSHLARSASDKDYVEFDRDYAERKPGYGPYAKGYLDRVTGKRFAVCKGLPMVRADGTKLTPGWERGVGKYHPKTNLFVGEVDDKGRIAISPTNDQPDGSLTSDVLVWQPRLYLGGVEVKPISGPVLLPVDPVNPNLNENTIKWNYGICERWIRTIQGRLFERWVFFSNPGADVRIVHNKTGNGPFRLGQYAIDEDVELVSIAAFKDAEYPLKVSAGGTFYPDAHEETSSVDSFTQRGAVSEVWAVIKAEAGLLADDSHNELELVRQSPTNVAPYWAWISRSITVFDASAASGIVSSTSLSFYGSSKGDDCGTEPEMNVYSANPASNTAIVAADHTTLGTTPFCDTNVAYADWSIAAGYNNVFDFNATGKAAIQAALDGDGIVKLGQREALYDVGSDTPTHPGVDNIHTSMHCFSADQGNGPKLVIGTSSEAYEHSISGVGTPSSIAGMSNPTSVAGIQ